MSWWKNIFIWPPSAPFMNEEGYCLLRASEGLKLVRYKDSDGKWRIGYGCPAENRVIITAPQADRILRTTLRPIEVGITKCVKVPLNENQFSALCCFVFNVGLSAFSKSGMLECINQNELLRASAHLLIWTHVNGKESEGLLRRREAERDLFFKAPQASKSSQFSYA